MLYLSCALVIIALGYLSVRGPKKIFKSAPLKDLPTPLQYIVLLIPCALIALALVYFLCASVTSYNLLGYSVTLLFATILTLLIAFHKQRGEDKELLRNKDFEIQKIKRHSDNKLSDIRTLARKEKEELENKFKKEKEEFELKFQQEKESLLQLYQTKLQKNTEEIRQRSMQIMRQDRANWVNDIYTFDEVVKDDFFELKKYKENLDKKKEALEKDQFRVELDEKISKANEHVLQAKSSALEVKSENVDLRSDIRALASDFKMDLLKEQTAREKSIDSLAHQLEMEQERRRTERAEINSQLAVMDAQTKVRFAEMHSSIANTLKDLQVNTANAFRQVHENMSDMKLQFGKEIVRLDGQQGKILTELEKYYAKNQQFINQCQSIAMEAKRQNLDGQKLLNNVETLYKQHSVEVGSIENRLRSSMDEISLKERQLANSVGESMLKLKYLSDEQYSAMRELAIEKKDVDLLWREKNSEHDRNLQEVRHQKDQLQMTHKLQSQVHRGDLQDVRNERGLLDMSRKLFGQEQSSFERHRRDARQNDQELHRNFIKEEQFKMALGRAQRSGVWLDRWGR